jgi:hypothetical protein
MKFNEQDRSYSRVACHPERSLVILSAAKDLALDKEMLREVYTSRSEWAQHDTTGCGRYSSSMRPYKSPERMETL